jgi:hypothetical protein
MDVRTVLSQVIIYVVYYSSGYPRLRKLLQSYESIYLPKNLKQGKIRVDDAPMLLCNRGTKFHDVDIKFTSKSCEFDTFTHNETINRIIMHVAA